RNIPVWLRDPLGPLAITPQQAIRSIPWFVKWLKAGRHRRMIELAGHIRNLHAPALDEWRRMLGPELYARYIKEEGEVVLTDQAPLTPMLEVEIQLCKAYGINAE